MSPSERRGWMIKRCYEEKNENNMESDALKWHIKISLSVELNKISQQLDWENRRHVANYNKLLKVTLNYDAFMNRYRGDVMDKIVL